MAAYDTEVTSRPPFVTDVSGEIAPNGNAIGLRIQRSEQDPVDLCLRIEDVQHLISMMLVLSCEAKRVQPPSALDALPSAILPVPLTAINVGQDEAQQTFLMLEVGATALTFTMPSSALEELGRTLMALSAPSGGNPS